MDRERYFSLEDCVSTNDKNLNPQSVSRQRKSQKVFIQIFRVIYENLSHNILLTQRLPDYFLKSNNFMAFRLLRCIEKDEQSKLESRPLGYVRYQLRYRNNILDFCVG